MYREKTPLSDLEIKCEDGSLWFSRYCAASASEVLRKEITGEAVGTPKSVLKVETEMKHMEQILKWMDRKAKESEYAALSFATLAKLVELAHMWMMHDLLEALKAPLRNTCTESTECFSLDATYSLGLREAFIKEYVRKQKMKMLDGPELVEIALSDLIKNHVDSRIWFKAATGKVAAIKALYDKVRQPGLEWMYLDILRDTPWLTFLAFEVISRDRHQPESSRLMEKRLFEGDESDLVFLPSGGVAKRAKK